MKKLKTIYIILPIILFILLTLFIRDGGTASIEQWVYTKSTAHMSPIFTNVVLFITHIGDGYILVTICLLLLIVPITRKKYGIPVGVAVVTSTIVNSLLKSLFARERPNILRLINETNYSFPSGHAMNNSTLYILIIMLTWKYIENKKIKWFITILCSTLTLFIGYSRIYLGVHYIGDIIGGWILGFFIARIVFNMVPIIEKRWQLKK